MTSPQAFGGEVTAGPLHVGASVEQTSPCIVDGMSFFQLGVTREYALYCSAGTGVD